MMTATRSGASQDQQGNPIHNANASSIALYDRALNQFNLYRGDPIASVDQAIEAAPDCAMFKILKAWLFALATEPTASTEARQIITGMQASHTDERAASHISALQSVLSGQWSEAASRLDFHNMQYPRDLLAIQAGHLLDFYRANARNLRDRIARVMPHWSSGTPGFSVVMGMGAFGLEECGDYGHAEEAGQNALATEPADSWAHHAVAHVLEMQGRSDEGDTWMRSRQEHWASTDNLIKVHNWWHWALVHLGTGDTDEALALYDGPIRADKSDVALDLVDASSLLWRLTLLGRDPEDRWQEVAVAWDQHADGQLYAFNDWHAAMAYIGAGRIADCESLLKRCREQPANGIEAARWANGTGTQLIEGFLDFAQGNYADSVQKLYASRVIANSFGGSHAQRDVIDCTLIEAAIRAGMGDISIGLANERLALRPENPMNQMYFERADAMAS